MPTLAIIPAAAVSDPAVSDLQLRVLCAIGTYTSKLGGEMWASVRTLAKTCQLSERSIQRALPVLLERGYLRKTERAGRTNLYAVVLEKDAGGVTGQTPVGVTVESPGGDRADTPGVTTQSPERYKENGKTNGKSRSAVLAQRRYDLAELLISTYPPRPEPILLHRLLASLKVAFTGVREDDYPALERAILAGVHGYTQKVQADGTEPLYRISLSRFLSERRWTEFREVPMVYGRTREQWARSGQDVLEFDSLWAHFVDHSLTKTPVEPDEESDDAA